MVNEFDLPQNIIERPVRKMKMNSMKRIGLQGLAAIAITVLSRSGYAQEAPVFAIAQTIGREVQTWLLWFSGLASVVGFMMAGHAFSSGDIDRGKTMLKGTLIGTVCIFGAVALVQFIQLKFGQQTY